MQPELRVLDRAFRLFREDLVAPVREALAAAAAPARAARRGPRPCVFKNAVIAKLETDAAVPHVVLEFDLPERLRKLGKGERVRRVLLFATPVPSTATQ